MPISVDEETRLRFTPTDGHIILLVEPKKDQRTFSDYANVDALLDTFIQMYQQYKESKGESTSEFSASDFNLWIDGFYRIDVFMFAQRIARYKHLTLDEFKQLFLK